MTSPVRVVRSAPVSSLYLAALLLTTAAVGDMGSRAASSFLRDQSTNVHNMVDRPIAVLASSALWVHDADALHVLLWLIPFALVMIAGERWLGSGRLLALFVLGHVGATLLTVAGISLLLWTGHAEAPLADTIDVGVSYGLFAVVGALTHLAAGRWRLVAVVALVAWCLAMLVAHRTFTDAGHLLAVGIGLAGYQVLFAPGGRGTSNALSVKHTSVVVAAQRDDLDDAAVAEERLRGGVARGVDATRLAELPRHRVHDALVVLGERRVVTAGQSGDHVVVDTVLARHAGVGPPLELRLPAGADGDDGELDQPAVDRHAEPQHATEVDETSADVGRRDPRVERSDETTGVVDDAGTARRGDRVEELLAGVVERVARHGRKARHAASSRITRACCRGARWRARTPRR
jgi:hypothetical protein